MFFPMILLRSIEPPPAGSTPPGQGQHHHLHHMSCHFMHTKLDVNASQLAAAANHGTSQVATGWVWHEMHDQKHHLPCSAAASGPGTARRGAALLRGAHRRRPAAGEPSSSCTPIAMTSTSLARALSFLAPAWSSNCGHSRVILWLHALQVFGPVFVPPGWSSDCGPVVHLGRWTCL